MCFSGTIETGSKLRARSTGVCLGLGVGDGGGRPFTITPARARARTHTLTRARACMHRAANPATESRFKFLPLEPTDARSVELCVLPGVSSAAASIPYLTKRDVWFELCFAQVLSQETKARHQDARQGGKDNSARREDQDLREPSRYHLNILFIDDDNSRARVAEGVP